MITEQRRAHGVGYLNPDNYADDEKIYLGECMQCGLDIFEYDDRLELDFGFVCEGCIFSCREDAERKEGWKL